ncbi:P-loop containing nucleoside triphosphate hydrolase protein [Rickenella mellea]|uniref:P-loop containing nucleoside triphosphate hydrolase protein n=1 Tax=Rickenella mellea TaxID=50990 RepID=A0A4Y7PYM8_9AGAM|nr:P-loop containing nucleoside triphosphate hydrolase protein [Rickenella mellea]
MRRLFCSSSVARHDNPLGLPRRTTAPSPTIPRRQSGLPKKRKIANVRRVVAVASGKGGVGKSTVAVNLAFALAMHNRRPRVGLLDLDLFGPSIPKLMGLERSGEPHLTDGGALVPLMNHGMPCMSMGFLLPSSAHASNEDTPVVWRGLMVQKAVQQLLFDVDWSGTISSSNEISERARETGLDILVVDLPPGTGDVPLTLGQLVEVDGSVIVSTPQDVSLSDVRRGVAMFRKVGIPITGLLLNQSLYTCPTCHTPHHIFGPPTRFREVASGMGVDVLGEMPVVPGVGEGGDKGVPFMLSGDGAEDGAEEWRKVMGGVAGKVWDVLRLDE